MREKPFRQIQDTRKWKNIVRLTVLVRCETVVVLLNV